MTVEEELGRRMGEAMAEKQSFDIWLLFHKFNSPDCLTCHVCSRKYKVLGWLTRHLIRSKHWNSVSA